jgi:hypothetical protein
MSRRGAAAQKQEHRAACYYWAMRWAILFLFVGMFTIAPQQLLSQEPAGEKTQPRSEFWTREGFPSDQQPRSSLACPLPLSEAARSGRHSAPAQVS